MAWIAPFLLMTKSALSETPSERNTPYFLATAPWGQKSDKTSFETDHQVIFLDPKNSHNATSGGSQIKYPGSGCTQITVKET
jgi:hypothetical protein